MWPFVGAVFIFCIPYYFYPTILIIFLAVSMQLMEAPVQLLSLFSIHLFHFVTICKSVCGYFF